MTPDDTIIVTTKFDHNTIDQTVKMPFTDHLVKQVVDMRDQGVKDALIALGWTPPKEPTT